MENIAIHEKINSGMCRLCLCSGGTLIDMYSFSSELECQIADVVLKCTSVHVEKHSELPTTICEPCYKQLIQTRKFQMQALKSDKILQLYLQQLHDADKQSVHGSSVILPDIDMNSCFLANQDKVDNQDNSTDCEEIKSCDKYFESDCGEYETDIVENKVFILESKPQTEWNVDSSNKDHIFNPNLIVKAEPITNENDKEDQCIDTEIASDLAISQKNKKLENEDVSTDNMITSYKCDVCNKHFSKSTKLKNHKRIHTGEKPYQCGFCNKCFSNSANLNRHQRIHTGEKPYQCDKCNKCFTVSGHLHDHARTHTGEKPHTCDVCNKSFSKLENMKTHQRVHSGEKPYQCDVCNKSFSKLDNLRTHQRVHTGEKPYQCDVCNKSFTQLSSLNNHKRKHALNV